SYKNNKNVAEANGSNGPVVVVKGKGNYTGTMEIPFTITKADLSDLSITVKAVAYNANKAESYAYQPAVTIKDGSKTLSGKTDFTVEYENNTQAAYKAYYLDKAEGASRPVVKITAKKVSGYTTEEPVIIELPVYRIKLTTKNVYAVISETSYTGKQATPEVELYYSADHKVIKDIKAKGLTSQAEIEAFGLVRLDKADYQVSYGTNIFGGVNKGSLKIEGRGALYGGSVSLKFNIGLRDLNN
ncbi:MAG: hypothetical protein IKW28_07575, partial [Lachnospiraceae bacterium]|nr:hypothetical protein [Lachnospiraceae bacterium]